MKLLTLNFLTCAIKPCKSTTASFPLHTKECTLEKTDIDFQPAFMRNILPRIDYSAMQSVCAELGLSALLPGREEVEGVLERLQEGGGGGGKGKGREQEDGGEEGEKMDEDVDAMEGKEGGVVDEEKEEVVLKKLHTLLLETSINEGRLVCGNCGFEYPVKEGVGNFLLPAHLV
jgi:multifunctional methyltransferase subunit TRM112